MDPAIRPDGTYVLREPVALPDVLDLLIVGGGPAGTAAAFRAKELGIAALVIDYDDLMKRIRDYAADKQILPHFGGGDKMKFPKGGDLVARLHFDPIDKDDLCVAWRRLYHEHSVPAQIGVELTGLERRDDGLWHAQAWNHKTKAEQVFLARHVAIAMGRGVPRRFDIPGNTDGIAYRLDDADRYVGAPALVIGGGTSAAEAVIAISNAKDAHQDACRVYWSYRGDKMPKVSKALADVFFDAYVGNGNILYYPNSEPVAVVTGPDRREYLSLRVDRKSVDARPSETVHLEFSKEHCMACIGEDIPEAFLNAAGIYMLTGGPAGKKRMAVTPLLESQQPNVYLIGDILSQAYLETDDFYADAATFREVKHRGNIKMALRDGVFVTEVVRQKLDGRDVIQVDLVFEDDPPAAGDGLPALATTPAERDGPPPESIAEDRAVDERTFLVRITPAGVEEDEFDLRPGRTVVLGREHADLAFPEDTLLSTPHAALRPSPEGFVLSDEASETGTFFRLRPAEALPLAEGDLLRLGRQILVIRAEDGRTVVLHYDHTGALQRRHPLQEGTIVLGRQAPDLTLDADDLILSRRHLALVVKDGRLAAKDLNSLNGTYLKVRRPLVLRHDDVFRAGQQIFRLSIHEPAEPSDSTRFRVTPFTHPVGASRPPSAPPPPAPPAPAAEPVPRAPAPPQPAPAAGAAPAVTFQGMGTTVTVQPGQTICDAAEAEGIDLRAECHAGVCGSDPVRILSGREHLSPLGDEEAGTLEDICGLEPGPCRLACMVKTRGPVVVEFIAQ
ncbi:MAG: FHA domain-containing protein [Rhodothermales bacterium]|nr:FHA domain-containing protein [Rhodothermales bacterium]